MSLKLTNNGLDNLKEMDIDKNVLNTEAKFYLYPDHKKYNLLKVFFIRQGVYLENKTYTLRQLLNNKNKIFMDEIVFPKNMVYMEGDLIGYTMPYVNGINLDTVLNCDSFSNKDKIKYLKKIGFILNQMKKIRKDENIDFYINDLHASNFIVDKKTDDLKVIDVDSFKINDNLAGPSKYLSKLSFLKNFSKYDNKRNSIGGLERINENTDIYCYVATIFKLLFDVNLKNIRLEDYHKYLEILSSMNISKELVDMFYLISTEDDNKNPYYLLDELEEVITNYKNIKLK